MHNHSCCLWWSKWSSSILAQSHGVLRLIVPVTNLFPVEQQPHSFVSPITSLWTESGTYLQELLLKCYRYGNNSLLTDAQISHPWSQRKHLQAVAGGRQQYQEQTGIAKVWLDVGQQQSKGWAQGRTWNQSGLRPRSSNQAPQVGSFQRLQPSPSPSLPKTGVLGRSPASIPTPNHPLLHTTPQSSQLHGTHQRDAELRPNH